MRSTTIKWMILIASILIAIILIVQLYWLNKVYSLEQKQFNSNVVRSIRGLLEDVDLADFPGTNLQQLIEHPSSNSFLVTIDSIPRKDTLAFYMRNELEDFQVGADCVIAVYDDRNDRYFFQSYLPTVASRHPEFSDIPMPTYQRNYTYLHLFFPHRQQYILQQLGLWLAGSLLLLLVLVGFAASLFYLYKQKTLNEIQKDFVNNFTHEFKTPLAVMKLASDVITRPSITKQPERLVQYGNIIKDQTEHLQTQVEKLLRTASTDEHKLQLELDRVVPNDLIRKAVEQLDPLVREKNVRIDLDLEEDNHTIIADASHLGMLLVNLIENAIKYSREPVVLIRTSTENGHYVISVKDNGIGIEKKYLKHLFKKFFRVPTGDVHNVKGFGLGLNFVKSVVDAHHGKVVVNSLPQIGTEFKILLPRQ
jgi:two-component system, OmpR family, phosphate regulon sensor histidine kinase PhoR